MDMTSRFHFIAICAAFSCLFAEKTSAREIVGTVHIVPAEEPGPQRARPKDIEVRYVSERDPNQVFTGKTDAAGRYRVVLNASTIVEAFSALPAGFSLFQNYPNPFNPSTVIPYQLHQEARVSLRIYNILGQPVRTLVDSRQPHGLHSATWDGRDDGGTGAGAGVYFVRLMVDRTARTKKMVLTDGATAWPPGPVRPLTEIAVASRRVTADDSYRVVIDGYKLVPFEQDGVVADENRSIDFTVAEDPRDDVVFLKAGRKELFLDTFALQETVDVERVQHQLRKYAGNPVIRPEHPWEFRFISGRSAPYWNPEEERYEFRYWAFPPFDEDRGFYPWTTCLAVSDDGFNWEKPIVGLFEFEGSTENNMLQPTGLATDLLYNVLYDTHDPDPQRRWKALLGAVNPLPAVSADGIHFTPLSDEGLSGSEENHLFYDDETDQFVFLGRTGVNSDASRLYENRGVYLRAQREGRHCNAPLGIGCARKGWLRSVWMLTSKDFASWSQPPYLYVFAPDRRDQELGQVWLETHLADPEMKQPLVVNWDEYSSQIYNMAAFPYEGIYIGFPTRFRMTGNLADGGSDGFNVTGLSSSRDMENWLYALNETRPDFIPLSPEASGQYDLVQIMPPSKPLHIGDELVFLYSGSKFRSYKEDESQDMGNQAAFNLGTLRLDGFVSMRAGDVDGEVVTKPLVWRGSSLWINADADGGEIRVELLNDKGELLNEAWSLTRALPISADGVRLPVRWQQGGDLSGLKLQNVRSRFSMRNAELFAFWTE